MKKKKIPKVQVNIPTYNNEKTIEKSLYSIVNQSYKNICIKIIDNGSTDATLKKIRNLKDKRISITHNKKTRGMFNLAKAYNDCKASFLCVYHSDDIYHKDIIKEQINFLNQNKKFILVSTKAKIINENDKIIGFTNNGLSKYVFKNQIELLKEIFNNYNIINCPTVMLNNKLLNSKKVSWNIKNFGNSADLDFYIKLLELGHIKILNNYLCSIRVTKDQLTNKERTKIKKSDFLKVIDYYLNKKNLKKKYNQNDYKNILLLKLRDQIRILHNLQSNKKKFDKTLDKVKFFCLINSIKFSKRFFYTALSLIFFKFKRYLNLNLI